MYVILIIILLATFAYVYSPTLFCAEGRRTRDWSLKRN